MLRSLRIYVIIYILIYKDQETFMKFWALVFELSRSQDVCGGGLCATRPKPIYPQIPQFDLFE